MGGVSVELAEADGAIEVHGGGVGGGSPAGQRRRPPGSRRSRYKRVIGDTLRSQTDGRQATEVAVAVGVLNRMLELGRPEAVRIA